MNLATFVLLFFIYSGIGYISEVIYCSARERKFVNRGFLYGPLCPIYGFGGLLVVFLLQPFSYSFPLLFLMAVLVTTILEYVGSWVLEKLFDMKWWDYSDYKLNINGRVCALNSVLFGLMGIIAVYWIHPLVLTMIENLKPLVQQSIASVLLIAFIIDVLFTLRSLIHFVDMLARLSEVIQRARVSIDNTLWFNEKDLRGSLQSLREKMKKNALDDYCVLEKHLSQFIKQAKSTKRLFAAFPRMRSKYRNHQLSLLKRFHKKTRAIEESDKTIDKDLTKTP
jgi:uncharacterized membrane protein